MDAKFYVLIGSHPSKTVELAVAHKHLKAKRVELPPAYHRLIVRALGFPRPTVPAMKLDGRRIQGSIPILRALEELQPEPRLYPAASSERAAVEAAERWGEQELQELARIVQVYGVGRDRNALVVQLRASSLPVPPRLAAATSGPVIRIYQRATGISEAGAREALHRLPADLDRVDRLIKEGTLGGPQPNAADLQIAPSLRMLMTFGDLRPLIEPRPAGQLALRYLPEYPSAVRVGTIPADWPEFTKLTAPERP